MANLSYVILRYVLNSYLESSFAHVFYYSVASERETHQNSEHIKLTRFCSVHIRLANEITTENQLRDAISSVSESIGVISEFCVSPDYRQSIPRYCFFVESQNKSG
jgi:hypothetical protein